LFKNRPLNPFKKLLSDTAIYGVSSIVGRFLNWWLVPYHTGIFEPEVYGIVSNLYSYVAFAIILLTYGMETGFFRFASRSDNQDKVYSTSMVSLFSTTLFFLTIVWIFREHLANAMQYPGHSAFIWWLALTVGLDSITAIPFARLRLQGRPVKFAVIKIINIGLNIGFNLWFLSVCPWIFKNYPDSVLNNFYNSSVGVGYVFIANLLASTVTLFLLYKELSSVKPVFDKKLLRQMLSYSFPILVIGLAGMINQNIDKILIPFLLPADQNPMFQLGIYGANYKLAVLMNMFIQAFRYAFEPFFFARSSSETEENPRIYAIVMKYFIIFGLLIFLGMVLYLDIVKHLIASKYHSGLKVVPIILMADLFFGVFFSASIWYKLKDRTWYGAYIALIGASITLALNILLIPVIGYIGSAFAVLVCYFIMMVINYFWGQKFYKIPYDLKRIALYFFSALVLYSLSFFFTLISGFPKFLFNTILMISFLVLIFYKEKKELISLLIRKKG
jgi:O-antigen/teichoic acid export membrane protein